MLKLLFNVKYLLKNSFREVLIQLSVVCSALES